MGEPSTGLLCCMIMVTRAMVDLDIDFYWMLIAKGVVV